MALILLIVIGALVGWIATVLMRVEVSPAVLRYVGVGVLGALVLGLIANRGSMIDGLRLLAVGGGLLGAVLAIAAYHFLYLKRQQG